MGILFMTCQAAICRTNKITFGLNKMAGWAAELAAHNLDKNHATS